KNQDPLHIYEVELKKTLREHFMAPLFLSKAVAERMRDNKTGELETDTQEKDKNKAQNDKTKDRLEKIEKDKVIRSQKSKVKARGQQKSTPGK
nr:glucose/ribitol dehydrogenase [Tanacetum cinerariifolium]